MIKSITVGTIFTSLIFVGVPGYAEVAESTQQVAAAQAHQGRGTVNKINLEAGKVNIAHEPIKSLKWPKMTMDFSVENKSSLADIKPGMKVEFELSKYGSGYRITRMVPAKE